MIAFVSCDLSGSIEMSMHEFGNARMTIKECDVEVVERCIKKILLLKFSSRHRAWSICSKFCPGIVIKSPRKPVKK